MKVSVVISTFNRVGKLKKAIESVEKQTYKDWELIVVHDGPYITTEMNYLVFNTNNKVRLLKTPKNHGNDTRPKNKGILEATGEYVAFLDDDNQWRPDHLQALVKELDADFELSLAYGDRMIVEDGKVKGPGIAHDFEPTLLTMRNYIDTSDVLVRRSDLLYVGGFDERYTKYIDWNLWLRLAKAGKQFKRVPLPLTDYHLSEESKSKKVLTKREREYMNKTGEFKNIPDWDATDLEIHLPYLGEVKKPRVAIFSLTYDRLEYTKACFESLYKTAGYEFDHFVIDNGSTDDTVPWLMKVQNPNGEVLVQGTGENEGISKGSNRALDQIMEGQYDIIGKVDNDCLFLNEGWLSKIVDIWKVNHMIALSPYVQGLKDNPGGAPRIGHGILAGEYLGITTHLGGICHFVDAQAYKNFRWDEESFLHGVQDVEFSTYLNNNGYMQAYMENWYIEHYKGTEQQHKDYPDYFERRKREKSTRYKPEH